MKNNWILILVFLWHGNIKRRGNRYSWQFLMWLPLIFVTVFSSVPCIILNNWDVYYICSINININLYKNLYTYTYKYKYKFQLPLGKKNPKTISMWCRRERWRKEEGNKNILSLLFRKTIWGMMKSLMLIVKYRLSHVFIKVKNNC